VPRQSATGFALRVCALTALALTALQPAVSFDRISADSLRTNVTWLAADERQGRMTPSPGLDASADYIGEQFRLAGLAPGGTSGTYFQTAPDPGSFTMALESGSGRFKLTGSSVSVYAQAAMEYRNEPVVRLPAAGPMPEIAGRVVAGGAAYATTDALQSLGGGKPSLILLIMDGTRPKAEEAPSTISPVVRIYNRAATALMSGNDDLVVTIHMAASRNVAGILPGSDPALRDQFVIVSAHYDSG